MKWSLYALLLGSFLDLLIGDPHGFPHPVIAIGKLISDAMETVGADGVITVEESKTMTTGMTTSGKSVRSGWVSKTPSISLPHITSGNAPYRSINEYEAYSATGNYFPDEPACSAVMFHSRTTFWSAPME